MKQLMWLAAAIVLSSCGRDVLLPEHVACDPYLLEFTSAAAGDTIAAGDGLRYVEISPGTGSALTAGTVVDFNYSGYLMDGSRFDTSCPAGRAVLRFTAGGPELIPGFSMGVLGMRPGGVRRLIIPPHLGYGSTPTGSIPANSTLIFDVQFVATR